MIRDSTAGESSAARRARHGRRTGSWLVALIAGCGWLMACTDPSIQDQVDELGGEAPGVDPGPTHRPGQPCVHCHQSGGPGSPNFRVAGTVFQDAQALKPLAGARVELTDADGQNYNVGTNCVGNFYITEDEWDPAFPIWSSVVWENIRIEMKTPIYREGACAGCHDLSPGPSSPGHVYLSEDPINAPVGGCK